MFGKQNGLRIKAEYQVTSDSIALYGLDISPSGDVGQACSLTIESCSETEMLKPMAYIDRPKAQELMDDLYRAGLRPNGGKDSVGAVQATEKHLNDMRAIVASKLKVDL